MPDTYTLTAGTELDTILSMIGPMKITLSEDIEVKKLREISGTEGVFFVVEYKGVVCNYAINARHFQPELDIDE
jgi:predicted PhzF superfamily epimerase YddE/YHI9